MTTRQSSRIHLSPPHLDGDEFRSVEEAFRSNWVAPAGPNLTSFEEELCRYSGVAHGVALSSGTAALHLALLLNGVGSGSTVICPSLTFVATANPIRYCGATPVFMDSEYSSWNLDPDLLEEYLEGSQKSNALPGAVIAVDIFGQCADLHRIRDLCLHYEIPLIEDAAEALGARCGGKAAGSFGGIGIFSFNGNKIITTSGGGMLVTDDKTLATRARKLATQAREPAMHYEHSELGYNYRLSNILAGIGRSQLQRLEAKVSRRRQIFENYKKAFDKFPLSWMPEADFGPDTRSTRWLSCLTLDPGHPLTPTQICRTMDSENIECRPVWKPLHLQPLYREARMVGGAVAEDLFQRGLCLPSGSGMTDSDQDRVIRALTPLLRP